MYARRIRQLVGGSLMTKTLPCRMCGTPISIPAKYARATTATCLECSDTGATPFGEKFAQVHKAGWYADHLKDLESKKQQVSKDPLARLCIAIEKIPVRTYHVFAFATFMALIAAFNLNGGNYQDASNSYLALAGIGAAATLYTSRHKED